MRRLQLSKDLCISRPRTTAGCELLLFRAALFCSTLFRSRSFLLRRRLRGLGFSDWLRGCFFLPRLGFLLRKLGSGELLSVKSNLGYANGAERLTVSCELLVLLFLLVVE